MGANRLAPTPLQRKQADHETQGHPHGKPTHSLPSSNRHISGEAIDSGQIPPRQAITAEPLLSDTQFSLSSRRSVDETECLELPFDGVGRLSPGCWSMPPHVRTPRRHGRSRFSRPLPIAWAGFSTLSLTPRAQRACCFPTGQKDSRLPVLLAQGRQLGPGKRHPCPPTCQTIMPSSPSPEVCVTVPRRPARGSCWKSTAKNRSASTSVTMTCGKASGRAPLRMVHLPPRLHRPQLAYRRRVRSQGRGPPLAVQ